jgi:hypothetical protein
MVSEAKALAVAPLAIDAPADDAEPAPGIVAVLGPDWATHRAVAGSVRMKIQTIC